MTKRKDYTGQTFEKLTAVSFAYTKNGKTYWNTLCECGNHKVYRIDQLVSGDVKSCGCYPQKRRFKHKMYNSRLAQIYYDMKQRCLNPNNNSYMNYGGRGISIYNEWLGEKGSINFINWALTHGYKENLTIDRINDNGNYCPGNCRWADKNTQSANRRNSGNIGFCKRLNRWRLRITFHKKNLLTKYAKRPEDLYKIREEFIIKNNLPHFIAKETLEALNEN